MARIASTEGDSLFSPVVLLLLLPLTYFILRHSKSPTRKLPPGPYPLPILGNILQLGNKPHITLTQFAQIYGPLFSLRLGSQVVVVGCSKAAATEILKTHDRALSGRYVPHMAPTKSLELNKFSLGWVLECNERWKHLRTMCKADLFSSKALDSQARLREEKVMEMVRFIRKMTGKVVKVREVVTATVFNMLSSILMSKDLVSLENESQDGGISSILKSIAELASTPNVSDLYPMLSCLDLQGLRRKALELHKRSLKMFEAIIRERREGRQRGDASDHRDFLDTLIDNGSSNEQINVLLLELLSAGTDTSSSTIEWAMAELIKHKNCLKKVQEEISMHVRDRVIKESNIPQLNYLQACVKETLRLHPPGPFLLPHRATESCQVMNYTVPKNSQVLVNFWAIGRDAGHWEDPLVFNPDRFLNSNLDFKGNDFEYIPFGSGRRICPGLSMAAKHVPLIIAYMVYFFDWSLPCGQNPSDLDLSENYGLTLRKEQPLLLVPNDVK